ncbi:MAG: hypothetical protein ACJZ40_02425 [Candidatus Poseidoniaceae archaeon]|tara:strand:+ start:3303 stop:3950 length:648 start_codon:yes stop_codon:yes gene_type:complete
MSDLDLGFSMRMEEEDSVPSPPVDMFAIRPDTKGPKSVAVLIVLGALLLAFQAWGDYQLHAAADLSDEEVELLLTTPNSQASDADDLTPEQYQKFHDEARESGGYLIRAVGLGLAAALMILGSGFLFRLNPLGAWMNVAGAGVGLASGAAGSWLIGGAAASTLTGPLLFTYEILPYFCSVCMVSCLSIAALPLLNARARLALYPSPKVELVVEEE